MRFNVKDFFATALVAAIIALYIAYLQDSGGWIISSTRATTVVVAVLGIGACGLGRVEGLYAPDRSLSTAVFATWASMLGSLALIAIVVALVSADPAALATLVVVTAGLWVTATARHLSTARRRAGNVTARTGPKAGSRRAGRPWAMTDVGDTVGENECHEDHERRTSSPVK